MEHIIAEGRYDFGVPSSKDTQRLNNLLHPIRSDPFIPENIRSSVIDLLENRLSVMNSIYFDEFEKYSKSLATGKKQPIQTLEERNSMHNKIIKMLNERGCGVSQIEEAVHGIRRQIQEYFDSFNPHRRWWNRISIH